MEPLMLFCVLFFGILLIWWVASEKYSAYKSRKENNTPEMLALRMKWSMEAYEREMEEYHKAQWQRENYEKIKQLKEEMVMQSTAEGNKTLIVLVDKNDHQELANILRVAGDDYEIVPTTGYKNI